MKYYLTALKNALTKIEIREIWILILGALFVNHLTQSEHFPLNPAYQFPLLPIGFTVIVGLLLTLMAIEVPLSK